MTWPVKIRVMLTVTLVMAVGFTLMMLRALYLPCMILAVCGCSTFCISALA